MILTLLTANSFGAFNFIKLNNTLPSPVGIDYQPNSSKLIVSVNHFNVGLPHSLMSINTSGNTAVFSQASGMSGLVNGEVKLCTVRVTSSGFTQGDVYAATGGPGEITKVSADGSTIQHKWCVLKDSSGNIENAGILGLHVDRTGVWGNQLIVAATTDSDSGSVWKVDSNGNPTLIARVDSFLEGVSTVPVNSAYGPASGAIIAGTGDNGNSPNPGMWVIQTTGSAEPYDFGLDIEDLDIAESGWDFYVASVRDDTVYRVAASNFSSHTGKIIAVTEEDASVHAVVWNSSLNNFESTLLGSVSGAQFEHACFAPVQVTPLPTTVSITVSDPLATEGGDAATFRMWLFN